MVGWQEIASPPSAALPWLACYLDASKPGAARQRAGLERASAAEGVRLVICRDLRWATDPGALPLGMLFDCSGGRSEECARWVVSMLKPELSAQIEEAAADAPPITQVAHELLREVAAAVPVAAMVSTSEVDEVAHLMRAGVAEVFAQPLGSVRFRRWLRERVAAQRAAESDYPHPVQPPLSAG